MAPRTLDILHEKSGGWWQNFHIERTFSVLLWRRIFCGINWEDNTAVHYPHPIPSTEVSVGKGFLHTFFGFFCSSGRRWEKIAGSTCKKRQKKVGPSLLFIQAFCFGSTMPIVKRRSARGIVDRKWKVLVVQKAPKKVEIGAFKWISYRLWGGTHLLYLLYFLLNLRFGFGVAIMFSLCEFQSFSLPISL